ncbi:hypothetical protein N7501_002059 [Penicillium viridicatum]|nr:hypothetical protein N7501_002059 [Penicillium viridicatum]
MAVTQTCTLTPSPKIRLASHEHDILEQTKTKGKHSSHFIARNTRWAFADMAYTAAKNGCNGLVRSGAVKLSSSNTPSRLTEEGVEYQLEKTAEEIQNESDTIYQRFGLAGDQRYYYNCSAAPEEIANVDVFLASYLAMAINGEGIVADSGKSVAASGDTFHWAGSSY